MTPGEFAEMEVLLTLTPRQHAAFTQAIAKLRSRGAPSNTAAILDAVRSAADNDSDTDDRSPK